ncbi:MAG: DUF4870 domain-containing protein [Microbacterium sp.]|uniref:DUF4870 domain-containing protein n=1 Tax=Microbacterium sp. TaxID=51671 RepID=UPI0039E63A07
MSDTTPTPDQPQVPQQPATPQQPPAYQQPPAAQPGYPPQYASPNPPYSPETDKQLAMWAHIGGIVGFLPSLIIWLIGKDRGPRTNVEAKEALNWQITWEIVYFALWIVNIFLGFTPLWPVALLFGLVMFALWVVNIIFSIIGGVRVNAGGSYRYPVNFRFIK